jgi:hypothetical protein
MTSLETRGSPPNVQRFLPLLFTSSLQLPAPPAATVMTACAASRCSMPTTADVLSSNNGSATPRPLQHKSSAASLFKLGSGRKPLWSSHAIAPSGENQPPAPSDKPAGFMQLLRSVSSASTRSAENAFGVHKSKRSKTEDDDREPFKVSRTLAQPGHWPDQLTVLPAHTTGAY